MITDFVWNDLHQVQLSSLYEKYENGGLNLQEMELKNQALRIKWLKNLILCKNQDIEKFLCNKLIDKPKKIIGLKILHASNNLDKNIMCSLYKEAVQALRIIIYLFSSK